MVNASSSPAVAWPGVSVVIPTWNGLSLLTEYLPSVRAALLAYPGPSECLVVDDAGSDATAAALPTLCPEARLIRRERNGGFSAAVTDGLAAAAHDLALLLNNDIHVEPGFLAPLAAHFMAADAAQTADLFAVSSLQINPGAAPDAINPPFDGCRALRFAGGELRLLCVIAGDCRGEPPRPSAFANGGCTLFSRAKAAALGGFCELFNPFYYEDAELSAQALRRGWRIVFEPASVVWHRPNSTTKQHGININPTVARNSFLFHWLLLDDARLWLAHLLCIPVRLASRTLQGRLDYAQGLAQALVRLPALARTRAARARGARRSLREILRQFAAPSPPAR